MRLRNKKTGEIGEFFCSGDPYMGEITLGVEFENEETVKYNSLSKMAEEWEDYEEPKDYWYIDLDGEILNDSSVYEDKTVRGMKEIGNYFETKEEAEKAVEKLKAWKRLKDRGFIFCGYEALGCGEIHFTSDWDIEDEYEKGQRRKDLDLLFGGEE